MLPFHTQWVCGNTKNEISHFVCVWTTLALSTSTKQMLTTCYLPYNIITNCPPTGPAPNFVASTFIGLIPKNMWTSPCHFQFTSEIKLYTKSSSIFPVSCRPIHYPTKRSTPICPSPRFLSPIK